MKTPILVVDDRPANLVAFAAILEAPDYHIISVTSGAEALAELERREVAVVLLDLQMPAMNGIETAERIRAHAAQFGRRPPIIFVTAIDVDRASLLRAYASGAVDLIQKPIEPEVLSAKVAVFAQLHRARALAKQSGEQLEREQQSSEDQGRRFRLLVESVKDYAIFILDPTGRVSTWNAGAERIKGYTAQEIVGQHFSKFYPLEDIGKCDRELEIATAEGRFEEEGWRIRKDGSRFWANVTITALRDPSGVLVGFAKVTRDLTERVRHEETQRALAEEKAALAEKARIQEFQERFIAILGHDLRNPLSAIDGEPGRPVRVEVSEKENDVIIISVHNEGPPMPEKLRTELFSPFRRGEQDSRTADTAGLGLGLYIAHEIIVAHGGAIEVRSVANEGTTFRVTLPRAQLR